MRHVTQAPVHPPSWLANPRDGITACDQVPHSDKDTCEIETRAWLTIAFFTAMDASKRKKESDSKVVPCCILLDPVTGGI